jgi:hypothetical protein
VKLYGEGEVGGANGENERLSGLKTPATPLLVDEKTGVTHGDAERLDGIH